MATRQLDKKQHRVYINKNVWYCSQCSTEDLNDRYFKCTCDTYDPSRETHNLGRVSHSTGESQEVVIRMDEEKRQLHRLHDKQQDYLNQKAITADYQELQNIRKLKDQGFTLEDVRPNNMFLGNKKYAELVEAQDRVKELQKLVDAKKDVTKHLKGALYYWITISPPEDKDPALLQELMRKLETTTMFKDSLYWCYVYEWRHHDEPGGFHVHMVVQRREDNKEPNKDARTVNSVYKKIYGIEASKISVCMFGIKSEEAKNNKVLYMKGNKQEKKMDKVKGDVMLRQSYGLQPFYEYEYDIIN